MKQINEAQLESDCDYRFSYLAEFIGFGEEDINVIHGAAEALAPLVPGLVDAVYEKLFSYDCTKRHFMPRQHGYEGDVPENINDLEQDHDMIQFRKKHLGGYLVKLVTKPYDGKMVAYLDMVGKMHTPKAGSDQLDIPLVQMNALMGFVADAFVATILGLGLDKESEGKALRAFSKLLWIQNDLITRHYQGE
ncbi:hypothetical protein MNBD_PLANCTO02-2244 [hydrothermal vent metagenome]|uniref:Globin-sensor domain-containing protein n=1 Tax=hydrothermal vent metagenome TaxID=652676 RepID=A0A3B1DBH3_9ZZZZ